MSDFLDKIKQYKINIEWYGTEVHVYTYPKGLSVVEVYGDTLEEAIEELLKQLEVKE
jgi:hypothetical protein